MKIPGLARIKELIEGTEPPVETSEIIMLEMYGKSVEGEPLVNILIDEKLSIDKFDKEDLSMFILGYALGQRDYLEDGNENTLNNITDDSDIIH